MIEVHDPRRRQPASGQPDYRVAALRPQSPATTAPPLWNPGAAGAWSILFGWAFGGFLLARNWRALGEPGKARRAMLWFYTFPAWVAAALLTPDTPAVNNLFRLGWIFLFVLFCRTEARPQAELIKQRFAGNYPRKPWAAPLGIASALLIGVVLLIVGAAFGVFAGYGTKLTFNNGEVYYKPPVTEAEAKALGSQLVSDGYFDGRAKSIQLLKSGDRYEFRAVTKKGIEKDEHYVELFKVMGRQLSKEVFHGAPVDVHLCDEGLQTVRAIAYEPEPAPIESAGRGEGLHK